MPEQVKLLILDDEVHITESLKKIFDLRGYKVKIANNADGALEIYFDFSPEICIIDVYLENSSMNGLDVLEKIREKDKDTMAIIYTQAIEEEIVARVNKLIVYEFLSKMCDTKDVINAVNAAAEIVQHRRVRG